MGWTRGGESGGEASQEVTREFKSGIAATQHKHRNYYRTRLILPLVISRQPRVHYLYLYNKDVMLKWPILSTYGSRVGARLNASLTGLSAPLPGGPEEGPMPAPLASLALRADLPDVMGDLTLSSVDVRGSWNVRVVGLFWMFCVTADDSDPERLGRLVAVRGGD